MPKNDILTIKSVTAPTQIPENEWKRFISVIYKKSFDDALQEIKWSIIEKIKKEESETTPINPLSSKEDLKKTTRQQA